MIWRPAPNATVESAIEEKESKCEKLANWFLAKCQNIHANDQIYAKMSDMVWYCSNCQKVYTLLPKNKLDTDQET